jgi:hypothetical protein
MAIKEASPNVSSANETWVNEGVLARHETFCPRYGWLKKGFDAVSEDSEIFDDPEAIEYLGVGKNMVRAIRFWSAAFKIIEPEEDSDHRRLSGPMKVTEFGRLLLSDQGWDPYLEDPASLWLLHWKLFSPPIIAISWAMAMNLGHIQSFTLKDLTQMLNERKKRYPALSKYSPSSIAKDASCFLRMYSPTPRGTSDEIECPFTELGLLRTGDNHRTMYFNLEDKPTLPDLMILAACLDYVLNINPELRTISLHKITYGYNSPGIIFKLSETDMGYSLERATSIVDRVTFSDSVGIRSLMFDDHPRRLFLEICNLYFRNGELIGDIQ